VTNERIAEIRNHIKEAEYINCVIHHPGDDADYTSVSKSEMQDLVYYIEKLEAVGDAAKGQIAQLDPTEVTYDLREALAALEDEA